MTTAKKTASQHALRRSVLVILLALFGCDSRPDPAWKIQLTSPDGSVSRSYTANIGSPKLAIYWGGQTVLFDERYNRQILTAPTGWLITLDKVDTPKKES